MSTCIEWEINEELDVRKSIKTKWVKALRSGDYVQGEGQLVGNNKSEGDRVEHCCLGVLACIVDPDHKTWEESDGFFGGIRRGGDYPSDSDATFEDQKELLGGELPAGMVNKLAAFNDEGKSFKWIAAYIERYL